MEQVEVPLANNDHVTSRVGDLWLKWTPILRASPAAWAAAGGSRGAARFDVASLTLAHEEHLDDLLTGYGAEVDRDLIRAWWSYRSLVPVRWLFENGLGPPEDPPEVDVLPSASWA